ncbi:NADH-quinone oxidoreductase subunit NuoN [Jannaschia seohaensis]|uniref:NADH-quinone oxidoreductase subunit N n=1 Tax=Jannaschia seohaensis TaxID=475081 RepID=A0A2Y9C911_9RHOB|nr:NADH-quinone oxidoreductase subunit NuoN [Jannaschia seohaensis]PWJ12492.1 NADH-quinone oxidoreductase subunit N [Jannaschia seohaensis]SSA50973.1 NADH-quinone oxidoreductase subunit N [Jannaschia seohaensis]
MTATDLELILPEILLAVYAMVALIGAVYTTKDALARPLVWVTAAVLVLMAALVGLSDDLGAGFSGMIVKDSFARFAQVTILLSAAIVLVLSADYMERAGLMKFEYPILITLSVIGMMVMVSSGNLLTLYMGLELQSLSLYVAASMRRDHVKSTEAGLKYFVLGALSSGLLLYGISLTYGYTGTTDFAGVIAAATDGDIPLGLLFGLVFMISGMAFKVSAAPFHMWTPDVYEGSPTPVTTFFATAPKVAAMGMFARVVHDAFGGVVGDWQQIVALLAVLSMFVGAIAAIGQRDIKRLMAYSSIAHMGYALMGLAAGTAGGVQAMLLYMAIYVVMNIGTFAFILCMTRDGMETTDIRSLNQLSDKHPGKALALLVLMFSLAGIPPMLGFFAKLAVLQAAVEAGLVWLAVLGVIASVIGAFYYLRIVFYMYFGKTESPVDGDMPLVQMVALVASAAIMLVGIINMFGLEGAALAAATTLVN